LQLLMLDTVGALRPAGLARCRSGRPCTCRSGTASQPPRRVRWQTHRTRSAPPSLPSHQPGPVQQATGQPGQLATPPAGRNGQPPPLVRPQQAGVLCRPPSTGSKRRGRDAGAWRFSRTTPSGEQGRLRLPPQAARTEGPPKARPHNSAEGGHELTVTGLRRYCTWSGTTSAGVLRRPQASR